MSRHWQTPARYLFFLSRRVRTNASFNKTNALLIVGFAALVLTACLAPESQPALPESERRAVAFLTAEVPAWSRDNGCFSCHNNGDAARALLVASTRGHRLPADALADTLQWLAAPEHWDDTKGDPGFSDQRLADVQFAAALLTAIETGHVTGGPALDAAARRVAAQQSEDGTLRVDIGNRVGSPATYGTALATFMAWGPLNAAAHPAAKAAQTALLRLTPRTIPDAAVALTFARVASDQASTTEAVEFLLRTQNGDGGWGPYADAPSEAFDTALALLALQGTSSTSNLASAIGGGRTFLESIQHADGSWPATTRPSGGTGYAQQMSTTAWATLSLIATRQK